MKIIVDAMGGDNAPLEIVKGALAGQKHWGVDIALTGDESAIRDALAQCGQGELPQRVEIVPTSQTVDMCDDPATVFRHKKDTSMGVGLTMLRDGKADALVSAGSTGALLTGATLITKRVRGIRRAAMAPVIPTTTGRAVLIDCGANAECTPEYLVQFAYLGNFYAKRVLGIGTPRVGLLNIGAEDSKGTDLQKQTLVRLREEMAFVGMYVDLLQVRFPEGFRVETDISDEAMNRHVLPCSVQLLIENAIKHNSVGADRPLVIRIVAVAEAVTVSNNLQLKVSGNPSTRVGLNYIRQQYLDLSGIPIGIRRTDTEYCVTLPLL